MASKMKHEKSLHIFQNKEIRSHWHNHEWHSSIFHIIGVIKDCINELTYCINLKQREPQLMTIFHGLKIPAKDKKFTRIKWRRS